MLPNDCAVLVLYNADKKMLLQHRTAYKKRWANYWGSFGGGMEPGEDPEVAMKREVLEEIGYQPKSPYFLFTQALELDKKHIFVELYDDTQPIQLNAEESQNCGWFSLEEARMLDLIPHDIEVVEKVTEYLANNN